MSSSFIFTHTEQLYTIFLKTGKISTDTRKIEKGSIFFALKGPNFNGNYFAVEALSSGADWCVIDEIKYKTDPRCILVEDVLISLQDLAAYHRKVLNIPIIAITGSNGKTTSKELVNAVLSQKFKTYATIGNLNNHIGIPLTLLAMTSETEIGIVEMGANHQNEIKDYCRIARPDFGLITNVGKAHLEGFGGFEGVKKGKGELYDYIKHAHGKVFINSQNAHLMEMAGTNELIKYSAEGDYYSCQIISSDPFLAVKTEEENHLETHLSGAYNFENVAAALCIGKFFGVPVLAGEKAIADYEPTNNRSQVMKKENITIILDAYNANPSSMKAALENFNAISNAGKVVVLGDMFELGTESLYEHQQLGKLVAGMNFEEVYLCGKEMKEAAKELSRVNYYSDKASLSTALIAKSFANKTILIKGSRGMGLETLIPILK